MLEELRKELHALIVPNGDLINLSDPVVVAKSQELDIEVNKAMYKTIEALKNS